MEKVEIKIPSAEEFVENMKEANAKDIKTEFIGRVVLIIIAGLGLISVLAWDDAIKDLYRSIVNHADSLSGKFGYAILITFIGVIISIILGRLFIKRKVKKNVK